MRRVGASPWQLSAYARDRRRTPPAHPTCSPKGRGSCAAHAEPARAPASRHSLALTNIYAQVFWHSSAHILGEALESLYGARLTHGPPTEGGFFYDSYMGSSAVTTEMTSALEKKAKQIADAKQEYERIVITKEQCLALFDSNPFKRAMIASKLPDGSSTTVYRCGPVGL